MANFLVFTHISPKIFTSNQDDTEILKIISIIPCTFKLRGLNFSPWKQATPLPDHHQPTVGTKMPNYTQVKNQITMRKRILDAVTAEPMTIPQLIVKLNLSKGQVTRNVKVLLDSRQAYRITRAGEIYPGDSSEARREITPTEPDIVREKTPHGTTIVRFNRHRAGGGQTHGRQIYGASTLASVYI